MIHPERYHMSNEISAEVGGFAIMLRTARYIVYKQLSDTATTSGVVGPSYVKAPVMSYSWSS